MAGSADPPERRIGVVLGFAEKAGRALILEFAQQAEALGYDTLWIGETWGRDVLTAFAQIAGHTSRIKLATGIVSVYSRTPALVAQSIASLDEISEGRMILGLGASSERITQDWHGVPFVEPVARTREYIHIINLAMAGERVDFQGRFFKTSGFRLQFQPPRAHVPIYLAALGRHNLELTGEMADGWVPAYVEPGSLPTFLQRIEGGPGKAGRDVSAIDVAPWVLTCASHDGALARQLARDHLGFFVAAYGHFYHDLVVRYGYVDEAAAIRRLWKADRRNVGNGVSDAMLQALAVAGTPEEGRGRYRELQALGILSPSVMMPYAAPMEIVRETVEAMAPLSRWS